MSQRLRLTDARGKIYVAYKVAGQRYETSDAKAEGQDNEEPAPRFELEDGRVLSHDSDDDHFEIIETGERLTRAVPAA